MERNQKCQVSATAPQFANRIGYFQFEGVTKGMVVLSMTPCHDLMKTGEQITLFAVDVRNLEIIVEPIGA